MNQTHCDSCGAALKVDRDDCEYCGTRLPDSERRNWVSFESRVLPTIADPPANILKHTTYRDGMARIDYIVDLATGKTKAVPY